MLWVKLSSCCLIADPTLTLLLFFLSESWILPVTVFTSACSLCVWSSCSWPFCGNSLSVDASLLVYVAGLKMCRVWVATEGWESFIKVSGSLEESSTDLSRVVVEGGFLSLSRLESDKTWATSQSGCWEFSSIDLDGGADWDTWLETTLFWGFSSWPFDWIELPLDPRWRLRLGAGTTPADPTWASSPRPLLSVWLEERLERNVLFFGTGLNPKEEPSDVTEPPEVWLASPAGWLFSGDIGAEGNTEDISSKDKDTQQLLNPLKIQEVIVLVITTLTGHVLQI